MADEPVTDDPDDNGKPEPPKQPGPLTADEAEVFIQKDVG